MEDRYDLARYGALDIHLHLGLHVTNLGDLHLDVGDLRLSGLDRVLRRLIAIPFGLHRHKNDKDHDRQTECRKDQDLLFALRWAHAAPRQTTGLSDPITPGA